MADRIKGKIAVVTGGASGIGAATCRLLASEGAFVIITDIQDGLGEALAKEIGPSSTYKHLDVSNENEWESFTKVMEKEHGRLDILFNNAGIIGIGEHFGPQDPENISSKDWHEIHSINMDGVFFGCKYGIKLMKKHGGSIINMSSRSGVVGIPTACAYASSKASIRNHTKSVALYCAQKGYGIRCNSLHPGAIMTPLWEPMLASPNTTREESIAMISAGIPLGHMGEPMDVAYSVLYLASDESKYVTGTEFTIDGGILAGSSASPGRK